jgi:two-component system, chemotaxis family, protein-glutamate methylesterase/glutaminase
VIRILVVDDSALVRKLLGRVFAAEPDFEVAVARDGHEALEQLDAFQPHVITLDVHMPGMDGLTCLDQIMVRQPCPVVMVSSLTAEGADATLEALRLGAVDFVAKPGGAVSLRIDELADELVGKVRSAARAKLRLASRLRERVRQRMAAAPRLEAPDEPRSEPRRAALVSSEQGLVVVGTSTGGPPALEALLTPLPEGFPWPIVVAQHMPRSFTGALAKRLDAICAISVVEVAQPTPLQPGFVYIGRGDADLVLSRRGGGLVAMAAPSQADYPWHPSTDRLVRSAMEHLPASQIVGILMTGMGDDGAAAMTTLHDRGGRTIAEAEETAVVWGMPGELVKAGGAEVVEPLHRIADRLQKMVR